MKRLLPVACILPFLFVCKFLETRNPVSEGDSLFNVTIAIDAVTAENSYCDITVSGQGMDTIGPERFNDSATIAVKVPVGAARRFFCRHYGFDGTLVDTGSVVTDVDNTLQTLTIKLTLAIEKPRITRQPEGVTVVPGQPAVFEIQAVGKAVQLQWQRNTKNISGATATNYAVASTVASDDGAQFRCILTNPAGADTSDQAVLRVRARQEPDTTRPVITLIGDDTVEIQKDDSSHQLDNYLKTSSIRVTDAGGGPITILEPDYNVNVFNASSTPYWIKYTAIDTSGNTATATRYVLVVVGDIFDTKPPWMSLMDDTMYLTVGDTFIDPGVTAFDLTDGDLKSQVKTSGTVNTQIAGTYKITYSVSDRAGNKASIDRIVIVSNGGTDNVPPVITLIGPDTLYIPKDQTIETYNFVEPGYTATDNIDGDITDKVVRSEMNKLSTEYWFFTYTVEDAAHNAAIPRRRFINTGLMCCALTIDLTFPDSVIQIVKGSTWKEPGYQAFDTEDGDITALVIVNDTNVTNNINTEGNYKVLYTVTNSSGFTTQSVRNVRVVVKYDVAVPVITLLGRNPDTVLAGSAPQYPEPGYVATDDVEGDLTAKVISSGTVTMKVPGKYTLTYNVSDEASNHAFATRTVWVVRDTSGLSLTEIYQVPSVHPLPSLPNKTYRTHLVDGDGPDLSTITRLTVNWDSTMALLRECALQYTAAPYYKSLVTGITQSFGESSPKMTLTGSTVPGLDGEYFVTVSGNEFIWVETGGTFAIVWQE